MPSTGLQEMKLVSDAEKHGDYNAYFVDIDALLIRKSKLISDLRKRIASVPL